MKALRAAGPVVLRIDGDSTVELDDGLLVGADLPAASDGHDNERIIVAQWLATHPDRARIVSVGSPGGWATPAVRIPPLAELCAAAGSEPAA